MRVLVTFIFGIFLASCQEQINFNVSPNGSRLDLRKSSITVSARTERSALTLNFTGLKLFDRLYVVEGASDRCEGGQDVGFGFIYDQNFQALTIHNAKDISNVRVLVYNNGERVCTDEISFQLSSDKAIPLIGVREMAEPLFTETSRTSFQSERPAAQTLSLSIPSYDSANGVVSSVANYQRVATGDNHSCAVLSTGGVSCWGQNDRGQLGDGTNDNSLVPRVVPGISNVISVSAGQYFTCVLHQNGTISCWGEGYLGQLGNGVAADSNVPVLVNGVTDAVELSASGATTCALLLDGKINCWGYGYYGQMGSGSNHAQNLSIHEVQNISNAVGVRVGGLVVCALLADGKVNCWGAGSLGRLGHGSDDSSYVPVEVVGITDAIGLGSSDHSCAVLLGGSVRCWGLNYGNQLGNESVTGNSNVPVEVVGLNNAISVFTEDLLSCALLSDGKVNCWGYRFASSVTPVEVPEVSNAVGLSLGYYNGCFLLNEGYIKCIGSGYYGQLGNGSTSSSSSEPVDVSFPQDIIFGYVDSPTPSSKVSLTKSYSGHDCLVNDTNGIECWGTNSNGELGIGSYENVNGRVEVSGISNAISVGVGEGFSCALLSSGRISCWGSNLQGRLGNNTTDVSSSIPVNVYGIENAVALSVGSNFSCALLLDGKVNCWGNNSRGRLGNNSNAQSSSPVEVIDVTNAVGIETGSSHACALIRTGKVFCWGDNSNYKLGTGVDNPVNNPREMRNMRNVVGLSLGGGHTCALFQNGTVRCVGRYLGTGSSGTGGYEVTGLSNVVKIASGPSHLCALDINGSIQCLGSGYSGELGNGTYSNSSTPVAVQNISNAVDIALGTGKSCATTEDRKLICWGTNDVVESDLVNSKRLVEKFNYTNYWIGPESVCLLTNDKRVQCVGRGIDLGIPVADPMVSYKLADTYPIDGLSDVVQVGISYSSTCALTGSGRMYCWGQEIGDAGVVQEISVGGSDRFTNFLSFSGQFLGLTQQKKLYGWNSQSSLQEIPLDLGPSPSDIISDGSGRLCIIQTNGKVYCYGANYSGELGLDPSVAGSFLTEFTEIPAFEGARGLKLLDGHTCGIFGANNELRCVGLNYQGQIGMDPTAVYSSFTLVSTGASGVSQVLGNTGARTFFLKNETLFVMNSQGQIENLEVGAIKKVKFNNTGLYILIGDEKNFIHFSPIGYSYGKERFFSEYNEPTSPSLFWEI